MHKIFLLLIIIKQICFASPFDITNEDYDDTYYKEETTRVDHNLQQQNIQKEKAFITTNKGKFTLISIKDGNKQNFTLNIGDKIMIQDINIELKNCYLEIDDFYHKISIIQCLINGKNIKFSNDFNINHIQIKDLLISVTCYN